MVSFARFVRLGPIPVALAFVLAGCAENPAEKFEQREDRLQAAFAKDLDEFSSPPVWLVKRSSYSPRDRTAVFFGYIDNQEACEDFAEEYVKKYEAEEYGCVEIAT